MFCPLLFLSKIFSFSLNNPSANLSALRGDVQKFSNSAVDRILEGFADGTFLKSSENIFSQKAKNEEKDKSKDKSKKQTKKG